MKSTFLYASLICSIALICDASFARNCHSSGGRIRCIGGGVKAFVPAGQATGDTTTTPQTGRLRCIGGGVKVVVPAGSSSSNSGPGMRLRCIGGGVKVAVPTN